MNRQLVRILAISTSAYLSIITCQADEPLQGRVEQKNTAKRVIRPALPSRPVGDAMEMIPNSVKKKAGETSTLANSVAGMLDKSTFDSFAKSLQGSADGSDKELVVEWEHWHKSLCSAIYHNWLECGNIPGDASVDLKISRSGDIDFQLKNFHVDPSEQFSPNQKQMFEHAVGKTLQLLDPLALSFPIKSQRAEVSLTTKFTYTDRNDGPQGYSWKHGDYERVTAPR